MIPLSVEELSSEDREKINSVGKAQEEFHGWLKRKGLLTQTEKESLNCQSYADFKRYWEEFPRKARSQFQSEHQQGWKRSSKNIQAFTGGADEFMKDFSPIIDFVRGATGPYGALAIGTISCLFAIASNKSSAEDLISTAISGVKDRLPGFSMYEKIYTQNGEVENELRKRLLLAYIQFVELAIEATKYYLRSGIGRWSTATWKPRKFEELTTNVQRSITAVRVTAEELVSRNVNALLRENQELKAEIKRLQVHNDDETLREFQELLNLSKWSLQSRHDELMQYSKRIEKESFEDHPLFETIHNTDLSKYQKTDVFTEWESSGNSSMLLIVGEKHPEIEQPRAHCWISPLIISRVRETPKPAIHAFYIFDALKETSLHVIAPEILFQILTCKKHVLGGNDSLTDLRAKIQRYRDIDMEDTERKVDTLKDVVSGVMELLGPEETVHIFLDRADRCLEEDQNHLLDMLIDAMESSQCSLKILAVASRPCWNVDERRIRKLKRSRYRQVTERQKMHQGFG